ncbi:aminotransferase class I/II-fold pyridoxal phosphate-dependent enzyme [Glutamicibacter sp.]|uniref:aminotransferase class I/II-fold pyridoxal phosphate-dependent enzyme n=1 Tax=Glutamicibacter sp. TaxID=1931995 RepID=UPI002FE088B0
MAELTIAPEATVWDGWLRGRRAVRAKRDMQRTDSARGTLYDLASNDYLGLGTHPVVSTGAIKALRVAGAGASASRVASGTWEIHRDLETALSNYTGRSQALVFSSGYTANIGVLCGMGGPGSLFLLDAHSHASLLDGAKLSGAAWRTFEHNNLSAAEHLLRANRNAPAPKPRVVLVVESLYSVLGDAAPLEQAAALCAEYGAVLLVDEAHSLAAVPSGSAVRAAGLHQAGDVLVTATLSKALGAQGGAVLFGGPNAQLWREHLLNTARTFIFDTALAPAAAGGALAALGLATGERIAQLAANTRLMRETLSAEPRLAGRVEASAGHVQSVRMNTPSRAVSAVALLRERGYAVNCFRPPSVPDGVSRLRLTAHANHHPEILAVALQSVIGTILEVEP